MVGILVSFWDGLFSGVISVSRECQRIDVSIPFGDKPKSCSILFHGSFRHSQGGLFVHVFIFVPVWRKSCSLTIVNIVASWFLFGGTFETKPLTKCRYFSLLMVLNWVVVSNSFYFHPYLGEWSNLTNIFQMGWNHHLVKLCFSWLISMRNIFPQKSGIVCPFRKANYTIIQFWTLGMDLDS